MPLHGARLVCVNLGQGCFLAFRVHISPWSIDLGTLWVRLAVGDFQPWSIL